MPRSITSNFVLSVLERGHKARAYKELCVAENSWIADG
jgi:hypothetical protein